MAGFFGIGDFTKEGKGVDKNAPKKRGVFAFFELFFRKFWRLCKLNLLYILACIPTFIVVFVVAGLVSSNIVNASANVLAASLGLSAPDMNNADFMRYTAMLDVIIRFAVSLLFMVMWGMGPVTAGYTYILRNYAREEHAWLWSDFWQYTRENFRQAIAVWVIDVAAFAVLFMAYTFYSNSKNALYYLKYLIGCMIFIYTIMHFYIYPIMVTFRLSLKNIYRNAFLFALAKLPINVFVFAVLLIIHLGIPYYGVVGFGGGTVMLYWIVYVLLELLIFISMSGFLVNFSVYPSLKKYMITNAEDEIKTDAEV